MYDTLNFIRFILCCSKLLYGPSNFNGRCIITQKSRMPFSYFDKLSSTVSKWHIGHSKHSVFITINYSTSITRVLPITSPSSLYRIQYSIYFHRYGEDSIGLALVFFYFQNNFHLIA